MIRKLWKKKSKKGGLKGTYPLKDVKGDANTVVVKEIVKIKKINLWNIYLKGKWKIDYVFKSFLGNNRVICFIYKKFPYFPPRRGKKQEEKGKC